MKNKRITIVMPVRLYNAIRNAADNRGVSFSKIVRICCIRAFKRREPVRNWWEVWK